MRLHEPSAQRARPLADRGLLPGLENGRLAERIVFKRPKPHGFQPENHLIAATAALAATEQPAR